MKKPLGRGLSSLIGEQFADEPTTCPIDAIIPNPRQPRQIFDDISLRELADSIQVHGVMNPLIVRPGDNGGYILIAGERRLRAAKIVGLKDIPIRIQSVNERESLELAIVENVQREDIGALECARAYRQLIDDFQLTQAEVAQKVGKSRVAVTNQLRLLNLPPRALNALAQGTITEGHARALLSIDSETHQLAILDRILIEQLSVRQVEALSNKKMPSKNATHKKDHSKSKDTAILEEQISEVYGCPVTIQVGSHGGKITFTFFDNDDLTRLVDELIQSS